jgi:hypothetical protein
MTLWQFGVFPLSRLVVQTVQIFPELWFLGTYVKDSTGGTMTLAEFLTVRGWMRGGSRKAICPFHGDHHSSMLVNSSSAYCFTCGRLYTLWDFQQAFGVILDSVPEEGSNQLAKIKGFGRYSYGEVLFTYDFKMTEY